MVCRSRTADSVGISNSGYGNVPHILPPVMVMSPNHNWFINHRFETDIRNASYSYWALHNPSMPLLYLTLNTGCLSTMVSRRMLRYWNRSCGAQRNTNCRSLVCNSLRNWFGSAESGNFKSPIG